MDWLASIVRIAGASFPVASSFVQLQSEIDAKAMLNRVKKLEDPISYLHEDVPEVSRELYSKLKELNSATLRFEPEFYKKYSRPLAALESHGCIKGLHSLMAQYHAGLQLCDPSYIMYLCALEEDSAKMEAFVQAVDQCPVGQWLNGKEMEQSLPIPVKQAVFDIFESKGYGLCSRTTGSCQYMAKA